MRVLGWYYRLFLFFEKIKNLLLKFVDLKEGLLGWLESLLKKLIFFFFFFCFFLFLLENMSGVVLSYLV